MSSSFSLHLEGLNSDYYIHGSDTLAELDRLEAQYNQFGHLPIWTDTQFGLNLKLKDKPFLELGCGVASQTPTLLSLLPAETNIICVDIDSLKLQRAKLKMEKLTQYQNRYTFQNKDITKDLSSYENDYFSGCYICWVLEHIPSDLVLNVLKEVYRIVAPGGLIVINEVYMQTDTSLRVASLGYCPPFTKQYVDSLIEIQGEGRGNANIGAEESIIKLLLDAGFDRNNIIYKLKSFHNLGNNEWQKLFRYHLKENLVSAVDLLDKMNKFPKEKFIEVEREINTYQDLMLDFGHVHCINNK